MKVMRGTLGSSRNFNGFEIRVCNEPPINFQPLLVDDSFKICSHILLWTSQDKPQIDISIACIIIKTFYTETQWFTHSICSETWIIVWYTHCSLILWMDSMHGNEFTLETHEFQSLSSFSIIKYCSIGNSKFPHLLPAWWFQDHFYLLCSDLCCCLKLTLCCVIFCFERGYFWFPFIVDNTVPMIWSFRFGSFVFDHS